MGHGSPKCAQTGNEKKDRPRISQMNTDVKCRKIMYIDRNVVRAVTAVTGKLMK